MSTVKFQLVLLESSQQRGSEVDGPHLELNFFDPDIFTRQHPTDVHPLGVPTDAAVAGDIADLEV